MGLFETFAEIGRSFPSIKQPDRQLSFKEKLFTTAVVLVIYYALLSVDVIGVRGATFGLDLLQVITAARLGSFLTLGIGPLILASIFLQLLAGVGVINLNLRDPKQKLLFHEAQRTLTVIIAVFEAIIFSTGLLAPSIVAIPGMDLPLTTALVAFQLVLGAIIVMYLDEIITKHGIGSGISLFIAAGVSVAIVGGIINTFVGQNGIFEVLSTGGATSLGRIFLISLPLISTLLVFIGVAYGEGTRVKLPIHISILGQSRPLELPLFYVSNIPVIFASALILNINLFRISFLENADFIIFGVDVADILNGILYLLGPIPISAQLNFVTYSQFLFSATTPVFGIPEYIHAIIYVLFLSFVSVLFGLFWVETSNMDANSIAEQLSSTGGGLKGFRFDKRLLAKRLDDYVTPLTVLGSFLVGLLAGIADLTGAYGTGTGILLTVGILYRFYLQIRDGLEIYFPSLYSLLFGDKS